MKIKKYKAGFSFIDVMVAMSLLAMGPIALVSLVLMSLSSAYTAELRLVASGLAQEGVELAMSVRKSYTESVPGGWQDWEWYSTRAIGSSASYCVEYGLDGFSIPNCPNPDTTPLRFSGGYYQYQLGDNTPFYRTVTLTRMSADEVKVEVVVKWKAKPDNNWRELKVENRLWRWI